MISEALVDVDAAAGVASDSASGCEGTSGVVVEDASGWRGLVQVVSWVSELKK